MDEYILELKGMIHLQLTMKKSTHEQEEKHLNETTFYLCGREFHDNEETSIKYADHFHITGEYRGAACQYCNMDNLSLKVTEIPTSFKILKDMICTISLKDGGDEIDGLKPFDVSKLNYRVKDLFAFMVSSLTTLSSNLEKEDVSSIFESVKNYL